MLSCYNCHMKAFCSSPTMAAYDIIHFLVGMSLFCFLNCLVKIAVFVVRTRETINITKKLPTVGCGLIKCYF